MMKEEEKEHKSTPLDKNSMRKEKYQNLRKEIKIPKPYKTK